MKVGHTDREITRFQERERERYMQMLIQYSTYVCSHASIEPNVIVVHQGVCICNCIFGSALT